MNTYKEFYDFVGNDTWLCPEMSKMWVFYSTTSRFSDKLNLKSDFRHLYCETRDVIADKMTKEMEAMYGLKEETDHLIIVIDNQQRKVKKIDENILHLLGDNTIELRRQMIV